MERIAIIGCGRSGKSTLARLMGATLDVTVHHLDSLYWKAGWVATPNDGWTAIHAGRRRLRRSGSRARPRDQGQVADAVFAAAVGDARYPDGISAAEANGVDSFEGAAPRGHDVLDDQDAEVGTQYEAAPQRHLAVDPLGEAGPRADQDRCSLRQGHGIVASNNTKVAMSSIVTTMLSSKGQWSFRKKSANG